MKVRSTPVRRIPASIRAFVLRSWMLFTAGVFLDSSVKPAHLVSAFTDGTWCETACSHYKSIFIFIVLYCIVLYLYIYIALLEVHINQKCLQCQRPREKRAVLRE